MVAALVLLALVVLAGTSDRTGVPGALALAVCSLCWLLVNGPMEGVVILRLNDDHGLTAGDLVGLAGLGLAGWRLRGLSRR